MKFHIQVCRVIPRSEERRALIGLVGAQWSKLT